MSEKRLRQATLTLEALQLLKEHVDARALLDGNDQRRQDLDELITETRYDIENSKKRMVRSLTREELRQMELKLREYVASKRPNDLLEHALMRHNSDDWFWKNERGHAQWDWRMPTLPLRVVAERHFPDLLQSYTNTPDHLLHEAVERVKKHRTVRPIKQRALGRS